MPDRHVPRHKAARPRKRGLGRSAGGVVPAPGVMAAVAVIGAAGLAVGTGVHSVDAKPKQSSIPGLTAAGVDVEVDAAAGLYRERDRDAISRSSTRPVRRAVQREIKNGALPVSRQDVTGAVSDIAELADPRDIARSLMAEYSWDNAEFSCLDRLYISESDWDHTATNPYTGAYGIPQSLPPKKMASAGPDWRTSPSTQIEWGLEYIYLSYGTPCSAWSFKQANNWY